MVFQMTDRLVDFDNVKLYIYLLSQDQNRGYDTYDSIVVCAESEEEARNIHPRGEWRNSIYSMFRDDSWAFDPKDVKVKFLGEASPTIEKGIIITSFNAG